MRCDRCAPIASGCEADIALIETGEFTIGWAGCCSEWARPPTAPDRLGSRCLARRRVWCASMDVVVVGAGTFGASLAWWLARTGDRVTLVDQFEPGDARASSGGETRLYRCAHGAASDYTAMARRARTLWRELEEESGEKVLIECGLAWFAHRPHGWEAESERMLAAHSIPVERLDSRSASGLFPSFRGDDLAFVLVEPEAGVLRAESAVRARTPEHARFHKTPQAVRREGATPSRHRRVLQTAGPETPTGTLAASQGWRTSPGRHRGVRESGPVGNLDLLEH